MSAPIAQHVATYFEGEKNAGMLIAGIGAAMFAAGTALFPARHGLRAFALTLLVWGTLEFGLGAGLYLRTGPQVVDLLRDLARDAAAFYASEGARMAKVQRNFVVLEAVWLGAIAVTGVLGVVMKKSPLASGIALGILVNVSVLLAFDIVAERRGAIYERALVDKRLE